MECFELRHILNRDTLEKVSIGHGCPRQMPFRIIQKPKMQELSSLFMTHHINVMRALVKFHEYIPYSLGVMARTRFTIWN